MIKDKRYYMSKLKYETQTKKLGGSTARRHVVGTRFSFYISAQLMQYNARSGDP